MAKRRKKKPEPQLEWMRAKRDETICAHRRTWESRCRRYKVQESVGKFSEMGTTYYALYLNTIIDRRSKRHLAEDACEQDNKRREGSRV